MTSIKEVHHPEFEIEIKHENGESLHWDTTLKAWNTLALDMPLYVLLNPTDVYVSLYAWGDTNSGTALASRVAIKNLSLFMHALAKSTMLSVGEEQIILTRNEAFSLGIKRISKEKVTIYNAQHIENHKAGVYDTTYSMSYLNFYKEVQTLISRYNTLQNELSKHIEHYLYDPVWSIPHAGLAIGLNSSKLFEFEKGERHIQVAIKNISKEKISLIDNIRVAAAYTDPLRINIDILPDEELAGKAFKVLEVNESRLVDVYATTAYTNHIELNLLAQNQFPMMSNMLQKNRLDNVAEEHFTQAWQGRITQKIFLFTSEKLYLDKVGGKEGFDKKLEEFSPDIINLPLIK